MPSFLCKIGTADGRLLEKEFEAGNAVMLRASLEEQGFQVFSVQRRLWRLPFDGGAGRFGAQAFLSFNQELMVLLRSGLPILQVLDTISERMESGRVREVLKEIRSDVRGGAVLSEAFGKHPGFFPHLYIASLRAGERTGDLPVTLGRFIAYQKRIEAIKGRVRSASFYPILLSIAVVAVVLFLLFFVIPSFTQIYADAQVELPLATRVLIAFTEFLIRWIWLLVPGVAVTLAGVFWYLRTERGIRMRDAILLRLPFFGGLVLEYALLGYCRTLGTTLASGIPLVQAMQMSRGTLNNRILEDHLSKAIRRIEEGTSLSDALAESSFVPSLALRMIAVGETSGALSEMLGDVAEFYEGQVERRLEKLTTMIEPMMMLVMGLLIAAIVVAMYIPIFQLAGTVR